MAGDSETCAGGTDTVLGGGGVVTRFCLLPTRRRMNDNADIAARPKVERVLYFGASSLISSSEEW